MTGSGRVRKSSLLHWYQNCLLAPWRIPPGYLVHVLNDCMDVDYLLVSGSDLTIIPRSILERLAGQYLLNEVPVDVFEIGLVRSDMTGLSHLG